jgi:hypothetical protein
MKWDNDNSPSFITKFHMASTLASHFKAKLAESNYSLLTRNDRKRRTHAEIKTVVMIGGSSESGKSSPSKYKPSASSRFARASSTVSP